MQKTKRKIKYDKTSFRVYKRLWEDFISPYKWHLLLTFYFMIISAFAEVLEIKMLQPIIDKIFIEKQSLLLWFIGIIVIVIFLIKSVTVYCQDALIGMVGERVIADMQTRLFNHLCTMDHTFFHHTSTGKLLSRFTVDITLMKTAVSNTITNMSRDFLSFVFLVGLTFVQDWKLACFIWFIFPIAFYPVVYLRRKVRLISTNTQQELGVLTTALEQVFQGISVVKSFVMENYEKSRISAIIEGIFKLSYCSIRVKSASRPIMEFLSGIAIAVVIIYGGSQVMSGHTTAGSFFTFIAALISAYRPMKSLAKLQVNLEEGIAGAIRLFEILDTKAKIKDKETAKTLSCKTASIKFSNVSFSYKDEAGKSEAISDINLEAKQGQTIALVGASGAGKTTILNLIPRFFDTISGQILINGTDIKDFTLESLRRHLSYVGQDIILFDDTIRNNILYGNPNASEKEIIKAAKAAAADDFIKDLENGYDTFVGERGLKISGGQRQRIAISRAILKDAPILLLDEATSALDTQSERIIQNALDNLKQGKTTIVIAHRLSTIISADKIYVMDKGKIIEEGTHSELLKMSGEYSKLYNMQFKD